MLRRLRIVGRICIVLGNSRYESASRERLQVCLKCVSNLLGINLLLVHIERKWFQIFFSLCRVLDRRLRPLIERIAFDALCFRWGDILHKGVELALRRSAMLGKDDEQLRQCRIRKFSAHRFRRSRIGQIEPYLILPPCSHCILSTGTLLPDAYPSALGTTAEASKTLI